MFIGNFVVYENLANVAVLLLVATSKVDHGDFGSLGGIPNGSHHNGLGHYRPMHDPEGVQGKRFFSQGTSMQDIQMCNHIHYSSINNSSLSPGLCCMNIRGGGSDAD